MHIYYINLDARPDRRQFMEEQFARLGLDAERIVARTPAEITEAQRDAYCNPARRWSMTEGQYACNLSHIKAWQTLLASGGHRALILEDDAHLSQSLPRFLAAVDAQAIDIPLIRIESWPTEPRRYREPDVTVLPDVTLRRCLSHEAGAAGYILTRAGAMRLAGEPAMNRLLVDSVLFSPFGPARDLATRQTDPALCVQLRREDSALPEAAGSLGAGLPEHRAERRRHPLTKFARQVEGWLTYDTLRLRDSILQAGWRDVEERVVPFRAD